MTRTAIMRAALLSAFLLSTAPAVDAQQQDRGPRLFGGWVGFQGDRLLIAEPLNPTGPAEIRVYEESGDEWEQVGTIAAPPHEGGDYFGRFFAIDDRSLVVGGTLIDEQAGGVWIFDRDGDDVEFRSFLRPDEVAPEESFGRFGELHGDLLFVSSLGFGGAGAVWVHERDEAGDFVETALLQPDNAADGQFFGWSLAFDGERLLVGSFEGETVTGAAYVFTRDDSGAWFQEARLALAEGEAQQGDIGAPGAPAGGALSVGWFEGMALLGLPGRSLAEGAVYTFTRNPFTGDWVRGTTLSAFDRAPGLLFGSAFEVVDGDLWVGAPAAEYSGAIYAFSYDPATEQFGTATKIRNTIDRADGDAFGAIMAFEGDHVVVGQPGDDGGYGSAIVMGRDGAAWVPEVKLSDPGPPGLPVLAGDEVACSEEGTAEGYPCDRVDLLSFLPTQAIGGTRGAQTNDIWGWTDPENGREYAIVARTDGVGFVDITNPTQPVFIADLPKTPGSQANTWRDVKVFQNHAFVVADGAGPHGMQVFDLTRLRDVEDPPARFEADVVYRGIASAHNIVVNEATGMAYAVGSNSGGQTCGGGLHMIDINEPLNPTFLGCFQDRTTGRAGSGYSHDAMCIVYDGPDEEHTGREICFGANETGLSIADVTDKSDPVALSSASYPNAAYAHQGWITEDHRYFYLGDELDEGEAGRGGAPEMPGTRTLIWDVSDLDDPVLVKEHFGEVFATDHNLYIRGNLMYQSNYQAGLRILNIADPENPVEVGYFDTVPDRNTAEMTGSWSNYPYFESGTIAVTSRGEGVFFLRFTPRELLP